MPNPGGELPLREWSLVAILDKGEAIRAIKARHPHAAIKGAIPKLDDLEGKHDVQADQRVDQFVRLSG